MTPRTPLSRPGLRSAAVAALLLVTGAPASEPAPHSPGTGLVRFQTVPSRGFGAPLSST